MMSFLIGFFFLVQEPVIGVGDVLQVSVVGVRSIQEKECVIGRNGNVLLPLAGSVPALSLTTTQLQDSIARALLPYVNDPQVFVDIRKSSRNKICILGEVNSPGFYRFEDGYTIGETINLAQGATRYADLNRVAVRSVDGTECVVSTERAQGILSKPLDVIHVPRMIGILIMGEVIHPGVFTPTATEVTLSEVLSHPVIFPRGLKPRRARILSGKKSRIVSLEDAPEVRLKPGDVIVILRRANMFLDALNFVNRLLPAATFAVMIYWHYH
jgi:polysaccharide export outer membrane protein